MKNSTTRKVLILCQESEVPIVEESAAQLTDYEVETDTTEEIFLRGPEEYLREMVELINAYPNRYHGVTGTRDVTSVFANVICELTGKTATSVNSVINCQNKYISRKIQTNHLYESTPKFWLDSEFLKTFPVPPPFFAKPVRANVSYASKKSDTYQELRELIRKNTAELSMYNQYYLDSLAVSNHLDNQLNLETYNKFICEQIVSGEQVTVNGYVYDNKVEVYGIVKAAFHEDKISFSHHEWPYDNLTEHTKEKTISLVTTLVTAMELNNTFFNVELRIDEEDEKIHIIEVNSRAAFQFAKMTEAILGINFIQWLCDLSVGIEPKTATDPDIQKYPYCYNFELRQFSDKEVKRVPMAADLESINRNYPEVNVKNLITANTRLSDYKQNLESYRYCILDIPGYDSTDIIKKYDSICKQLGYEFSN